MKKWSKRQTCHIKRCNHAAIQWCHYQAAGCLDLYSKPAGVQTSFQTTHWYVARRVLQATVLSLAPVFQVESQ